MAGAMSPIYEQQRVDLERLQNQLDIQDFEQIRDRVAENNPGIDFELKPPKALEKPREFSPIFRPDQGINLGPKNEKNPKPPEVEAPEIKVEAEDYSGISRMFMPNP